MTTLTSPRDCFARKAMGEHVALISLHTSPWARVGKGDAGGMNVYLRSIATALARTGVQVDVYTRASASLAEQPPVVDVAPGVRLRHLEAGPRTEVPKDDLTALVPEFTRQLARQDRAGVVHSHYWLSGLAGGAAAAEWGVPHIQSLHTVASLKNRTLAPGEAPEGSLRLEGERALTQRAAAIVAMSPAERDAIVLDYGAPSDRVLIVPPGIDPDIFHPGPAPAAQTLPPALRREQGYLLMAGRIQPIKGQDLAVRAIGQLPAGARPALLVTGAPGREHAAYAQSLRDLAHQTNVADDVVFLGPRPPAELANLMRGAVATLMPSRSETYGLVALESAACGTPVIAQSTSGLRFSVQSGVTGLLVDAREPAAWARAIEAVTLDPALRARLAAGGIERGRRRTWDRAAQDLAGVYAGQVRTVSCRMRGRGSR
jgi:D-inositol-3-phosphate glycosyltransferase